MTFDNPFNDDAVENQGYLYSTNASLSSTLANRRLTDVTLQSVQMQGKNVLDIGCGDGVYTLEIDTHGKPKSIIAGDVADKAIKVARNNSGGRNIHYMVNSAYELPLPAKSFDVAILRGVLHHLDHPTQAIKEALRVADVVWVIEPNGYNPGLKFLEKFSAYHIEHGEKSYAPHMLDQWVEQLGGKVTYRKWAGFVPMFCPDWMARLTKWLEPLVEHVPLVKNIGCAVYTFSASSKQ
jgi:ubiquinone/menaquinone biosynthesis C-methylase UbiE